MTPELQTRITWSCAISAPRMPEVLGNAQGNGFTMPGEHVLRRIAVGCAIVLLFAPLGGRTTWVKGHVTATDAAGYIIVAILSGVVALAALALAFRSRPRLVLPVLGTLTAISAFGLTVVAAGVDVVARWQGQVWIYAGWSIAEDMGRKWTVYPAWGPPFFTLAALIGAAASLVLAISWLRKPNGYAVPHVSPR